MTITIKGEAVDKFGCDSPCKMIMGTSLYWGGRIKGESYIFDEKHNIFSRPEYIHWHKYLKFLYKGVKYVDGNDNELFRVIPSSFFRSKIVFEGNDYATPMTSFNCPSLGISIAFDKYNFKTEVLNDEFWKIGLVLSYNAYFSNRFRV